MTELVAPLGKSNATPFARIGPVVDVHAGVVHYIAQLGKLRRTDRALENLIHSACFFIQGVSLVEHTTGSALLRRLSLLHLSTNERFELLPHARIEDTCVLCNLTRLFCWHKA